MDLDGEIGSLAVWRLGREAGQGSVTSWAGVDITDLLLGDGLAGFWVMRRWGGGR